MQTRTLSNTLWSKIRLFLPKYNPSQKGGRPRLSMKKVLEGIIFIKLNKLPWKATPRVFGSKTALNDYYREWAQSGFFHSLKDAGVLFSDELVGVDFDWDKIESLHE